MISNCGKAEYVSVFKIDGTPILPPLMTTEKRKLMQLYRNQAISIENKRNLRNLKINENCVNEDTSCTRSIENPSMEYKKSSPQLQVSETLVYDVVANTVLLPFEERNTTGNEGYEKSSVYLLDRKNDSKTISIPFSCKTTNSSDNMIIFNNVEFNDIRKNRSSCIEQNLENSTSPIKSASCSIKNSITNQISKENVELSSEPQLARSNSFTLDTPSETLLEHVRKSANVTGDNIQLPLDLQVNVIEENILKILQKKNKKPHFKASIKLKTIPKVNFKNVDNIPKSSLKSPSNKRKSVRKKLMHPDCNLNECFDSRSCLSPLLDYRIDKENLVHIENLNKSFQERENAATVINKYVRGFLTRRLLRTFYVSEILSTLRYTRACALKIYQASETTDATHIHLMAQLLDKMNSESANLHNIFFQLSKKEQMAIISEDRSIQNDIESHKI